MHNKKKHSFLFYTPAFGWGLLICYFSLLPSAKVPEALISVRDFILHFLIYGALSVLFYLGANGFTKRQVSLKTLVKIALSCFLLGLILEILQELFAQGRHFELSDLVFNTLGIMLVFLVHKKFSSTKL